jgi:hypothetical protein
MHTITPTALRLRYNPPMLLLQFTTVASGAQTLEIKMRREWLLENNADGATRIASKLKRKYKPEFASVPLEQLVSVVQKLVDHCSQNKESIWCQPQRGGCNTDTTGIQSLQSPPVPHIARLKKTVRWVDESPPLRRVKYFDTEAPVEQCILSCGSETQATEKAGPQLTFQKRFQLHLRQAATASPRPKRYPCHSPAGARHHPGHQPLFTIDSPNELPPAFRLLDVDVDYVSCV